MAKLINSIFFSPTTPYLWLSELNLNKNRRAGFAGCGNKNKGETGFGYNHKKMQRDLSKTKVGSMGTIIRFTDELIAGKLMTMGVLPGSVVRVMRKAPFHGGLYIKIDGDNMVLREREAQAIVLSILD
ncbi:MAG TPA: ferrous iron transport protein A [Bacteroidetes bacterium]|nr:ferrous iron transport protein A [Bacteroidota bacterium]